MVDRSGNGSKGRGAWWAVVAFGAILLGGREAEAAGPIGPNGAPITTSDYRVDLFQGPILASSRVLGIAGAFTAIAEGSEGIPFNPAAVSHRPPSSTTRADWDITGGFTLPSSVTDTDFDNNGDKKFQTRNFVWGNLGGHIHYDKLGIGVVASAQNYVLNQPQFIPIPNLAEGADEVVFRIFKIDGVASYALLDEQLHVGGGVRALSFNAVGSSRDLPPGATSNDQLTGNERERMLFASLAFGVQGGVLWTPRELPIRLGGVLRSPLIGAISEDESRIKADGAGDFRAGNFYLPKHADLPWEIELGAAVQLWKRPFNLPWYDEDKVSPDDSKRWRKTQKNGEEEPAYIGARRMLRTRYRELPRQKVLISTTVIMTGPIASGVGFESMLARVVERSGERVAVGARLGVEAEVIPYWLVLRGGSYLEPTRFEASTSRLHGTGGLQVRLFEWDAFGLAPEHTIWRVSGAVDVARDYFAWSVGAGFFM